MFEIQRVHLNSSSGKLAKFPSTTTALWLYLLCDLQLPSIYDRGITRRNPQHKRERVQCLGIGSQHESLGRYVHLARRRYIPSPWPRLERQHYGDVYARTTFANERDRVVWSALVVESRARVFSPLTHPTLSYTAPTPTQCLAPPFTTRMSIPIHHTVLSKIML